MKKLPRSLRAFTLIELLTVIAIIGILAAIIIPSVAAVRTQARIAEATANLRSIHTVALIYAQDNRGKFPPISQAATPGVPARTWLQLLWDYQYPNREFPGYGQLLAGSIFYTPLIEDDLASRTFGLNERLQQALPSRQYLNVSNPTQVAFLGDVKTSSALTPLQANPRNRGRVGLCFVDGSVRQYLLADIPISYGDSFWSGN